MSYYALSRLNLVTILEFLKPMLPYSLGESIRIGPRHLEVQGKTVGTFELEDNSNVPIVTWIDPEYKKFSSSKEKRLEALEKIFGYPTYRCPLVYKPIHLVKEMPENIFLGTLEDKLAFSISQRKVDVYLNSRSLDLTIFNDHDDDEYNFCTLFSMEDDIPVEKEARYRAWAYLKTRAL